MGQYKLTSCQTEEYIIKLLSDYNFQYVRSCTNLLEKNQLPKYKIKKQAKKLDTPFVERAS